MVKGWSRADAAGPNTGEKAWVNEETGETVYVSHNVTDDGYYVMAVPADETVKPGAGERVGYDPSLRHAKKQAAGLLRNYPDGVLDGPGDGR